MKGWPLEEFNQFISLGQDSNEEVAKGHNSNNNVDVAPYLVATLTRVMRQSDQYVILFWITHHPQVESSSSTGFFKGDYLLPSAYGFYTVSK